MPWNETDREKYAVIRDRYGDLSDAEFALVAPLLPARKSSGRKPTEPRAILNALFYLVRADCPWRYLPKDFPPFTTVQNRFYVWRDSGLWEQIVSVLVMAVREAEGRKAVPTVVIVDSQSVKTTEAGGAKGYDAGKKTKGRKRHIPVDTLGLPITCQVTTADIQDRDALPPLLKASARKVPGSNSHLSMADTLATKRNAPPMRQVGSGSASSNAPTGRSKGLSCCQSAGSWSGPWVGQTAPVASPRTSKRWRPPRRLGSCWQ
jgi:transposase